MTRFVVPGLSGSGASSSTSSQRSPSMMSLPPRPSMRSLALAAEDDVAAGELGHAGAEHVLQTGDLVDLVGVRQLVAHLVGGVHRVAAEGVVELPPRQALDHVEAVADVVLVRGLQAGEVHVGLRRLRVALVGDPVEAEHALVALDPGAGDHDVVAALGVVVVVAALADDDVVAGDPVLLERVAVAALEQVGLGAALDPVVALVAEDGVRGVARVDDVVAAAGEGLLRVRPGLHEVVAEARQDQVDAAAGVDGVVAVAALDVVVAEEVGDDVVVVTAVERVVAGAALDPVACRRRPRRCRHRRRPASCRRPRCRP